MTSELKFQTILDNMAEGYYEVDLKGNFTSVNNAMITLLGYGKDELLGMNYRNYADEGNARRVYKVYNSVFRTGEPVRNFTWQVIRTDGQKREIEVSISLIRDGGGKPSGFRGIVLDITERRKAERALQKSEARYRLLAEKMMDIVWIMDMNMRTLYVSPSIDKVLGFSPQERLLQDVREQLTPASLTVAQEELAGVLAREQRGERSAGESITLILEYYHKDGSTRWLENIVTGIYSENGSLSGLHGVSRDITKRRKIEKELYEREERFRRISSIITDIVYSCKTDAEGVFFIDWMTGASERISGYTIAEIKARQCWEFMVLEEDLAVFEAKVTGLKPGQQGTCELRIRHKDGRTIWIASFAECVPDGDDPARSRLHGGLIDITVRKKMEAELRASEERWKFALEGAGDGLWDWNAQTNRVFFSRQWKTMLGYGEEEIGDTLDEWDRRIHPDDRDAAYRDLELHFQGFTRIYQNEHRLLCKDGTYKWIFDRGMVINRTADGKPSRVIGTHTDLTERKRLEDELRKSEQRYRELSIVDDLTQLYNVRFFNHQLQIEIERSNRYEQPLTLLFLDLDDFKRFNDAYGHPEGDLVLARFAAVVKRCLRQADTAYRYGGEEFAVILPMTRSSDGIITAERIRSEFKRESFSPLAAGPVHLTVSIGLAQHLSPEDRKDFVNRADRLMYQAKREGKDRICTG